MSTASFLTAAAYWELRQREGWFYVKNPRHQWRCVSRLGTRATVLAAAAPLEPPQVHWELSPFTYAPALLDTAWKSLVDQRLVVAWNEVPLDSLP